MVTFISKNKLIIKAIENLKIIQKQMKDSYIQMVRQIEIENDNLNDVLNEVYESNFELNDKIEVNEKKKQ